mmetsp:Transcript_80339/g.225454  ORF Transcript_80339/g.225454 Transcript_80339/m.225454 type:complete len:368 (+) Transcript_80339:1389-2492(+)
MNDEAVRPHVPNLGRHRALYKVQRGAEAQAGVLVEEEAVLGEVPRLIGALHPVVAIANSYLPADPNIWGAGTAEVALDAQALCAVFVLQETLGSECPALLRALGGRGTEDKLPLALLEEVRVALEFHNLAGQPVPKHESALLVPTRLEAGEGDGSAIRPRGVRVVLIARIARLQPRVDAGRPQGREGPAQVVARRADGVAARQARPHRVLVDVGVDEAAQVVRDVLLDTRDAAEGGRLRDLADSLQLLSDLGIPARLQASLAAHGAVARDIRPPRLAHLVVEGLRSVGAPRVSELRLVPREHAPPCKEVGCHRRVLLKEGRNAIALHSHDVVDVPGGDNRERHHAIVRQRLLEETGHHVDGLRGLAV